MYKIEHPVSEDLDAVFDFLIRCDIADFGGPDTSREDLEGDWSLIDLSRDAWIARDEDNNLTGYAYVTGVSEGCHMDIYVEPGGCPTALEDELAGLCVIRAIEQVAGRFSNGASLIGYATGTNKCIQEMYNRAGFVRHAYHYRMQIELDAQVEAVNWPGGYTLQTYRSQDEQELYTLIQRAFNWQGHVDASIDQWRNLVFRGGRFDPDCFILVRHDGELVGAALAYDEEGSGWIRQLAVRKDQQGKGLGGMLLRHMFHLFHLRGAASVALGVAAVNETAVKFYERNGMRRRREFIEYRRNL